MVIAGDIGLGTSYLGIFKEEGQPVLEKYPNGTPILEKYKTQDYPSMEVLLEKFLQTANQGPIDAACLGISGPVENKEGKIVGRVVGLPWELSEESLCNTLVQLSWQIKTGCNDVAQKQRIVKLVNSGDTIDFEGLLTSEDKLVSIKPGTSKLDDENKFLPNNGALITVRNSLGEALISWRPPQDNRRGTETLRVSFSEGGHANFAPSSELEVELLNYLLEHPACLEQPKLVTYQQVLSVKGMVCMYQFFKDEKKIGNAAAQVEKFIDQQDFGKAAEEIIKAALEDENALCLQVLDLFLSIYGAEAGNLALKYYALGGVYISITFAQQEDLMDKLINKIKQNDGAFMQAFTRRAKPQIVDLLNSIPITFIKDPNIRIYGAAHIALDKARIVPKIRSMLKETAGS